MKQYRGCTAAPADGSTNRAIALAGWSAAAALALVLVFVTPALADEAANDPRGACDRAAVHAEADWQLPAGLLAAVGTVESGRSDLGSSRPVAWPWSVNAGGRGFYLSGKAIAMATVRSLQAAGFRAIDVGCFQVDLFYHPEAFGTPDAAFDPEANAQAAARILTVARSSSGSWEAAIALYHSASATLGARYLRQVQAAWPWARMRSALAAEAGADAYAVLLPPAARLVKVISPSDSPQEAATDFPRVAGLNDSSAVLQWAAAPLQALPVVLMPRPRIP